MSAQKKNDNRIACTDMSGVTAIIEDCSTSKLAIIGDFNAKVGTIFESELISFCSDRQLIISDYDLFGRSSDKYTYVSDAHSTTSWLDHFICSYDLHTRIVEMQILEKSPIVLITYQFTLSLRWILVQLYIILVMFLLVMSLSLLSSINGRKLLILI